MALATQCPHCGTTFRVAHDQLKLRAGLVRCGACKQIFNGIEHLMHAAEPAASPARAQPGEHGQGQSNGADSLMQSVVETEPGAAGLALASPPQDSDATAPDAATDHALPASARDQQYREPAAWTPADEASLEPGVDHADHQAPAVRAAGDPPAPTAAVADDPLQRMTLMNFAPAHQPLPGDTGDLGQITDSTADAGDPNGSDPDELERAIEDLQRQPLRRSRLWPTAALAKPDEPDEPDFMIRARRQRHGRVWRALLAAACLLLLLAAAAQGAYAFRSQLAAHFPPARPLLEAACATLGCRLELPMHIESVTIESSELQALAPDLGTFTLTILLRNRSATVEAWPQIELTLNDRGAQPLLRRVFLPREYLPAGHSEVQGFAANSEQILHIHFQLANPTAAGYRIYLFYP